MVSILRSNAAENYRATYTPKPYISKPFHRVQSTARTVQQPTHRLNTDKHPMATMYHKLAFREVQKRHDTKKNAKQFRWLTLNASRREEARAARLQPGTTG